MRISGGKARGVTLRVDRKSVHRPAMDRLRQSIFSSIGGIVDEAKVCDLFAGTGAYGLEALSRGARHATFVEANRGATTMIQTNAAIVAKSMRKELDFKIVQADVSKWIPNDERFDLIFIDPPYEGLPSLAPLALALCDRILSPKGLVVFEVPGRFSPEGQGWILRKRLGKGADQPTACLLERAVG